MSDILWRIDLAVTPELADAYEYALEPFCGAVTQYLDDDELAQRLEGYSDVKPPVDAMQAAVAAVATVNAASIPELSVTEVENKDWLAEYARANPPLQIGRYFIYGSHFEGKLPAGKVALKVEAATAFGTGEHASTNGCLQALDQLAKRYDFKRPLDMGCGSAILAMAIIKSWGVPVVASDIDANSVDVAAFNARVNAVGSALIPVVGKGYTPVIEQSGPYDLIMANILARPLSSMAKDLARNLQSGGFAVLAGFLDRDANWVFAAHRCHGLVLVDRIKVNGWQTLVLRKK